MVVQKAAEGGGKGKAREMRPEMLCYFNGMLGADETPFRCTLGVGGMRACEGSLPPALKRSKQRVSCELVKLG